jgi:hypothetical protein
MATESKWEAPSDIVTYLSTELNSLADGANDLGAKIDNVADGENELYIDLEFYIALQGGSRDADGRVEIYLLTSIDNTNFDMGGDSTDPRPSSLLCVFSLDAATTARYRTFHSLPIPPFDFKLLVMNETGQNFASSGNTLKYRMHSVEAQ